jgi:asparagine synthase (glutamine-hydrolysing)
LFGGYPTYIGAQIAGYYCRLPHVVRTIIKTVVGKWPASDKKVALSFLLKRFVQGQELDGVTRHLLWTANIPPALLERLGVKNAEPRRVDHLEGSLLDALQELDLETSLAEGLLTEKDRSSMSSAVELRSPFLDQAVLEFAATLPVDERVHGLTTKVFLKRYAERYLPSKIVHRRKRGLTVPLSSWLRGPLRDWARARVSTHLLDDAGVSSRAAVELLDEHCNRVDDHGRALWTLIVLSEWLEWVTTLGNPR